MSLRADAVIIAGGKNILHTFKEDPKRSVVILNCPEDYHVVQNTDRSNAKGNTILVYTGGIRRGRSLENLSCISNELNDVVFVFAGPIMDKEVFDQIQGSDYLKYKGVLQPVDALGLEAQSDI